MQQKDEYQLINIFDLIETETLDFVLDDISEFKSSRNDDVENFLKNSAVSFCKLKQSITYLLYDKTGFLNAYFTLAFKVLDLPVSNLSTTLLKKVERFGHKNGDILQLPCVLIAQLSKNYSSSEQISGKVLMEYVWNALKQIQRLIGGGFVFLECEKEKSNLLSKYSSYGFVSVNERDSADGKPLVQLIKKL